MKKLLLLLLTTLIITTLGYGASRKAEINHWAVEQISNRQNAIEDNSDSIDYAVIYQPVLDDLKTEYDDVIVYFAIYDIDKNGVPELLVKIAYNEYNVFFSYIYTIQDSLPILLFEPPYSRHGSSVILSNGLIDATAGDYSIYKITEDGYNVSKIAHAEPYFAPPMKYEWGGEGGEIASSNLAKWRYYVNNSEVSLEYYVEYLEEQSYIVNGENIEAEIEWGGL